MNREGQTFNWGLRSYLVVRSNPDAAGSQRHHIVDLKTLTQLYVSEHFLDSLEERGHRVS